jgi:ubiquinone biosynthesis protein
MSDEPSRLRTVHARLMAHLETVQRWQRTAQAVPRVAVSAVRHGLMPAGLAAADTVRKEGLSQLHWKVVGDGLVRFLRGSGPVFTKFGQILATRTDLLPATVCARLESLYARQPPMSRRELNRTLRRAYGKDLPFAKLQRKPLAVGSVGQVHRARLRDGRRAIVKLLRPGVEDRIQRDLESARALLPLVIGLTGRSGSPARHLLGHTLDDLAAAYAREIDLRHEARSLQEFARRLESNRRVKVPECYAELSSQHALVMEELVGEPLSEYRRRAETDPEAASRVANLALTEILRQIFEHGHFHADPHGGNLLVLEDGRLGVVDLGLTGELRREDRRRIARAVRAFLARDAEALIQALLGFGETPPDFDPARFRSDVEAVVRAKGQRVVRRLAGRDADAASEASSALDEFVTKLFGVAHAHGVHVPVSTTLLVKTLVTIEGVARSLHPGLDLKTAALPVIVRSLAPRWVRWVLARD